MKNIKYSAIYAALAASLGSFAVGMSAEAANLQSGDILNITAGVQLYDASGNPSNVSPGSYFGMDTNANSVISGTEKTPLAQGTTGLVIGSTTGSGASHNGCPNGTDSNQVTAPWCFFGNTGSDFFTAAPTGGTGGVSMSGWTVTWNSIPAINMGSGAWGSGFTSGVANFVWSGVYGDTYTLDYHATVPPGDPSGFGGVKYALHLVGTVIQAIVPTAGNDTASVGENTSVPIDVLINDDPKVGTIDFSSVTIGTAPANGGYSVSATDGKVTYTPNTNFTGTDSFTYTFKNSRGTPSNPATVQITVSSLAAVNDAFTTDENTAKTFDVTTNDTDSNGTINKTTVTIVANGSNGNATVDSAGNVTYTPTTNYIGSDSFTYTVNDSNGLTSNAATVNMTINTKRPASSAGTFGAGTTGKPDGTASSVPPDGSVSQQCVGGCFDFQVSGLSSGATASVVLPLTAAIPSGALYRKYALHGGTAASWANFNVDANNNTIASAPGTGTDGTAASCPPPSDNVNYVVGLVAGNRCVRLSIQDGGPNDADGAANGTITDPSGVAAPLDAGSLTSGHSGCSIATVSVDPAQRADWWIVGGFLTWMGVVARRKHRS